MDFPTFVLTIEDGNSKIVAMGLLVCKSVLCVFEVFVEKNPACSKTAVAMTDKDLTELTVIGKVLPNCSLRLSISFLRTFKRQITCDKLSVTPAELDYA